MNKKTLIPEAKEALQRFKVEAALEVGIKLNHTHLQNRNSKKMLYKKVPLCFSET